MNKPWKVLLVDDDSLIRDAFELILPDNWALTSCKSQSEIPDQFFHAAFVDMHLSGVLTKADGLDVIQHLSRKHPHLQIVAISGDLNRNLMEQCLKMGASRYLGKPFTQEEIKLILEKIEALHLLQDASHRYHKSIHYIGRGEKAQNVKKQIAHLRGEPGPILVEGESGTGKEVTVQMIHQQEPDRPFVSFNVSAVPETLFESELFGHVRGAFTGADQNKMGLAEAAHGGDLFLDEVEALPLTSQVKLLRFLETYEIRRVGDKKSTQIQVRVIAATNQNLEKLVEEGKFREDLLWRLNGKKITLPPLRDRIEDIPELAQHFLNTQKPRYNKKFADDAIEILKLHNWPGNVRELRRVVEQACLVAPLPFIRSEDVSALLSSKPTKGDVDHDFNMGLDILVETFEKDVIEKCFQRFKDIDQVAQVLRISRSGLYKKIKDYDIKTP